MYYFYFAFGDFEIGVVLEKMHSETATIRLVGIHLQI